MNKSKLVQNFILKHLKNIYYEGGAGKQINLPKFELYAFDYLDFAEKRLNNIERYKNDTDELINCVAHLKRAVDCQLDTFFHTFNLFKTISKRNLKFETKLNFLKEIGVFSSRSLSRLNTLRNMMEHQYKIPKIVDIELYYDLVSAFISVLQGVILTFRQNALCEYSIYSGEAQIGNLTTEYNYKNIEIVIEWWFLKDGNRIINKANIEELEDFTYFFKVHQILNQLEIFATREYIASRIKLASNDKNNGSQ